MKTFDTGDTGSTDTDPTDTDSDPTTTTTTTTTGDDGPRALSGRRVTATATATTRAGPACAMTRGSRAARAAPRVSSSAMLRGSPPRSAPRFRALPADVEDLGPGACLSRCNFAIHPGTGCREDYGCVEVGRANDDDSTWVCVPGAASDLPDCLEELAARGIPFEPTPLGDEHPSEDPSLTCHVEDPVRGRLRLPGHRPHVRRRRRAESVVGTCTLAHALADTLEDLAPKGAVRVRHLGHVGNRLTIAGPRSAARRHG